MSRCAVKNCFSFSKKKKPGMTFHRFPVNEERRKLWLEAIGRPDFNPSSSSVVCSEHFKPDEFERKAAVVCLKKNAVPKLLETDSENIPVPMENSHENVIQSTPERSYFQDTALLSIENIQLKRKLEASLETNRQYKKTITYQSRVIERQKKTIDDLTVLIDDLKQRRFLDQDALDQLYSVAALNKEFLRRQLSTVPDSDITCPNSYSPDLRRFALTLHFYSPTAYRYVRETFKSCLPCKSTICRWYQHIGAEPGFTTEAIDLLGNIAKNTPQTIVCALSMDEMAIRKDIEWDGKKWYGYINMGWEMMDDNLPVANNALTFMIVGINCSWKIPVGYFLINSLTTDQKCNLINQCLTLLHETGVKVVSLTCDGLSSNLSTARQLGCDFDLENFKTTFEHPVTKEPVAFLLDPCHMLKLVRNTLGEKGSVVNCNDSMISWNYITELNEFQVNEGLKLANKLSNHHVNYYSQKMKVKLASQVLSSSVADAIEFCNEDLELEEFEESEATVEFIRNFNDLFDILNSRNLKQFGFKQPINEKNEDKIIQKLNSMFDYIANLKESKNGNLITKSTRKTGFLGFLICIKSMIHLYTTLVKGDTPLLKFLPMYKFSQDHLEIFFSFIRYQCGRNNNPTARQFRSAYRKLLVKTELKESKSANCLSLEDIQILNVPSSVKKCTDSVDIINASSDDSILYDGSHDFVELAVSPDSGDHDYVYCPGNLSEFSSTIVEFIAGYVVKYLTDVLKCMQCVSALASTTSVYQTSLIRKKTRGGLKYPSDDVFTVCKRCEKFFRFEEKCTSKSNKNLTVQVLSARVLKSFQNQNIFSSLNVHMHDTSPLENHAVQLIRAIANKYFNIRMRAFSKKFEQDKIRIRESYTKMILFKGQ